MTIPPPISLNNLKYLQFYNCNIFRIGIIVGSILFMVMLSGCASDSENEQIVANTGSPSDWCSITNSVINEKPLSSEVQNVVLELNLIRDKFLDAINPNNSYDLQAAIDKADVNEISRALGITEEKMNTLFDEFNMKAAELIDLYVPYENTMIDNSSVIETAIFSLTSTYTDPETLANGCQWGQVSTCMALGAGGSVGMCGPFALLCYSGASYLCMCAYCSGDTYDDICI